MALSKMTTRLAMTALVACAVVLMAVGSNADPYPGLIEKFNTTGSVSGWENTAPIGSGIAQLSNPSSYLNIQFPARGGPPPPPTAQEDVIYTTDADFIGDASREGMGAKFQFYAEDALPSSVQLYFRGTSGREWLYGFSVAAVGEWEVFEALFDYNYGGGWSGGTEAQFLTDIQSVDAIGILIESAVDLAQQDYRLNYFMFYIPEPATWCLIAAVLIMMAFPFRHELNDMLVRS